jgi:hypothetical protein
MPRSLIAACAACAALLALAPAARAGGFATVGLDSTPQGAAAGEVWSVKLTIMAHGRTPLSGLDPRVRITSGATERSFAARPAGRAGVYRADVVFPRAGRWSYTVDDGYVDQRHAFPPVTIRAAAASSATGVRTAGLGDGGPVMGWVLAGAAALLAAAGIAVWDRRRA